MALTDYVLMPRADYVGMCDKMREIKETSSTFTSGQLLEEMASIKEGGTDVEVVYVYFMSHDGTKVLHKRAVLAGNDCMEVVSGGVIDAPTKESSNTEVYTFAGWSLSKNGTVDANALKNVTADRQVYAAYTASTRYYTISYYDGDTLLKTEQLVYGAMPDYEPEKTGYALTGWEPALTKVVGDAVYYAQWQEAEVILYSGTCGENATWIINAAQTLRISGTGATYDFAESPTSENIAPWRAYNNGDDIVAVEIEEGITTIGAMLLPWCSGVKTVTLPNSLTTIKKNAFYYADGGFDITIPANVTTIEDYAFRRAKINKLTLKCEASWGFYTQEDGTTAEIHCDSLETYLENIAADIYSPMYRKQALYISGVLLSGNIVIPSSVAEITFSAFYNISGITGVTIPSSVTFIGRSAFVGTGLTTATFENTSGWCKVYSKDSTSGTAVTITNGSSAASTLTGLKYESLKVC